jgi:serine/threonine protein kinase
MIVTDSICPVCGRPLVSGSPQGLCPECLMKAGFDTRKGDESANGKSRFVPPPVEQLASLFPLLEIIELLGQGGMGAVYKARQPCLDRFVALKILSPEKHDDPQFAERFEREARALARLNHPNIVAVYDSGQAQGVYYLLMEFVDGMTLRQLFQARKLASVEAFAIIAQVCQALQFAHEQGIIHRDIKPENILIDTKGQVKIADFGIAKLMDQEPQDVFLTRVQDVVGTPHYMSPEQIEKPQMVDHRADIYSLGVVFYEMLTGELPLGHFQPPSEKTPLDARVDEVVLRSLEKEPDRRYQKASEVRTDVETIGSTKPPAHVRISPRRGKNVLAGGLVLLTLIIIAGVVWLTTGLKHGLPELPRSGLVALWSGDGNANDSMGAYNGVPTHLRFERGEVRQAFGFDGSSMISFGNEAGNVGTNDFSMVFWIRTSSTATWTAVLEKRPQCDRYVNLLCFCLLHGHVYYQQSSDNTSSGIEVISSKTVSDGRLYHHVALTRQATLLSLYIDGALDATTNSKHGIADVVNTVPLIAGQAICQCCDGTVPLIGNLDEIALYNRALLPTEIKSYYNNVRRSEADAGEASTRPAQPFKTGPVMPTKPLIIPHFETILNVDQRLVMQYLNHKFDGVSGRKSTNDLASLHTRAFEPGTKLLRGEADNRPRWTAVRELGMMHEKASVPKIIHLLYHYNAYVRWSAQIALVQLTGHNFGGDWKAWGNWWNSQNLQPPFTPATVPWRPGQGQADALVEELAQDDRNFLESIKNNSSSR